MGWKAISAAVPDTPTSSMPSSSPPGNSGRRKRDRRSGSPSGTMTAHKTAPYIGRALKRVVDPRLIRGLATYVDDLTFPGLLHMAILRSPYAHANLTGIKTEAAKAVAGVVAVFAGA